LKRDNNNGRGRRVREVKRRLKKPSRKSLPPRGGGKITGVKKKTKDEDVYECFRGRQERPKGGEAVLFNDKKRD